MKIVVTLEPNINYEHQAFSLDDLGITREEWVNMDDEDRKILLLENIQDNIYSIVTNYEEYE